MEKERREFVSISQEDNKQRQRIDLITDWTQRLNELLKSIDDTVPNLRAEKVKEH